MTANILVLLRLRTPGRFDPRSSPWVVLITAVMMTLHVSEAMAANSAAWYANFWYRNPQSPNQDHLYAAGPYATKAQAIAAMLALDPNIDPVSGQPNPNLTAFYSAEKQLLVEKPISQMGSNGVQYRYAPSVPYPNPVPQRWNRCDWDRVDL